MEDLEEREGVGFDLASLGLGIGLRGRRTEGVEGATTRRGSPCAKSKRAEPVRRRERQ